MRLNSAAVLLHGCRNLRRVPQPALYFGHPLCAKSCLSGAHSLTLWHADINVTGTSSGAAGTVVVDLDCSQECEDITASGINITSPKGPATYVCKNVASEDEVSGMRICVLDTQLNNMCSWTLTAPPRLAKDRVYDVLCLSGALLSVDSCG